MLALNSFNFILVRLSPNINVSLAHIQARLFKKDVNANEDDFVFNNKIKEDKSINNYNTSDEPINLTFNPYNKEPKKCILCKHQIKLDYKNSRLLQQFVSSFRYKFFFFIKQKYKNFNYLVVVFMIVMLQGYVINNMIFF